MAPAGAPKEVVDKLYREIALIIMLLEVKARLAAIGYTAVGNTPEECSAQTKEGCRALGKGHPRSRNQADRVSDRPSLQGCAARATSPDLSPSCPTSVRSSPRGSGEAPGLPSGACIDAALPFDEPAQGFGIDLYAAAYA